MDNDLECIMDEGEENRTPGRFLSELVAILRDRNAATTVDPDFGADVQAAIAAHPEPLNPPAWD